MTDILNPFIWYDNEGEPHKLKIEDLHTNKECLRVLNAAVDLQVHKKLGAKLALAYHRAHLLVEDDKKCHKISTKFNSNGGW